MRPEAHTFKAQWADVCSVCHTPTRVGDTLTGHREEHGWIVQHPTHAPIQNYDALSRVVASALGMTQDARVLLDTPAFGLSWGDV